MNRPQWALLVVLLLAPTAGAEATGSFLLEDDLTLPPGAEATFFPLLAYTNGTEKLLSFELRAPRATIYEFSRTLIQPYSDFVSVKVPDQLEAPIVSTHEELHLALDGSPKEGILGFYPGAGASATFLTLERSPVEARTITEVDRDVGPMDSLRPAAGPLSPDPSYEFVINRSHIWMEGAGTLEYRGPGWLKVYGPDLLLRSSQENRSVKTGMERVSAYEVKDRWVVIKFENVTVSAHTWSPWWLGGPASALRWDGEAILSSVSSGSLESMEGTYAAPGGEAARITGRFEALATAERVGNDASMRMTLTGAIESTDLHLDSTPQVPGAAGSRPSSLVFLGGAAILGGLAGYLLWRRARILRRLTVEECMAAATAAADEEDWTRAIRWLRRVRRMAPTSARTCADLAHALCQTGRRRAGLRMYALASRLAQDGESDFNGAVVAMEAGLPPHEVEAWLNRALTRTPTYVVDVDSDPIFQRLRGRAGFERIVADAWLRVDDDAVAR